MHPKKLPIILCLHGMGTSASIFEAQTRNLRHSLRNHFRFVFIDAPHESLPGPGVVPVYVDSGPFYSWFPETLDYVDAASIKKEFNFLNNYIEKSLAGQDVEVSEIVAVLGFSQGTIVTSMLLYQAQFQHDDTRRPSLPRRPSMVRRTSVPQFCDLPGGRRASLPTIDDLGGAKWTSIRFGILMSGACNDGVVTAFMGKKLVLPAVHVHGLKDSFLERARMLHTKIYQATSSDVYEFDGGHNIPSSKLDVDKLTALILRLNRKTQSKKISSLASRLS